MPEHPCIDRACPHGDPTCPCQDGEPCHYEPFEETPAMACWSPDCMVKEPHERVT